MDLGHPFRNPQLRIGGKGIRTPDIQLAKLALYQLSYAPEKNCRMSNVECRMQPQKETGIADGIDRFRFSLSGFRFPFPKSGFASVRFRQVRPVQIEIALMDHLDVREIFL